MDETQLDHIEAKLDKLDDRQNKMDLTMVEQHLVLKEHVRRSELLEDMVIPIQKKITMVEGFLQGLGLLAVISGIVEVIVLLFRH